MDDIVDMVDKISKHSKDNNYMLMATETMSVLKKNGWIEQSDLSELVDGQG